MFIHTPSSAPKRFAKFGWRFVTKSRKSSCQTRGRQTMVITIQAPVGKTYYTDTYKNRGHQVQDGQISREMGR